MVQRGQPLVVRRISDEPQFLDRTGARSGLKKNGISYTSVPTKLGSEVIASLPLYRIGQPADEQE